MPRHQPEAPARARQRTPSLALRVRVPTARGSGTRESSAAGLKATMNSHEFCYASVNYPVSNLVYSVLRNFPSKSGKCRQPTVKNLRKRRFPSFPNSVWECTRPLPLVGQAVPDVRTASSFGAKCISLNTDNASLPIREAELRNGGVPKRSLGTRNMTLPKR